MFITIEGIDGSGKTLQLELLSKYFRENNIDFIALREPGGTKLGEKIRKLLLDESSGISEISEFLLFEASRAELYKKVIEPNVRNGKIVVCDRYIDSTIAYQGFARGINIDFIENINNFITKSPDLTIYLDIDVEKAYERLDKNNLDRLEKEGQNFQNKVREGYLFLAKKYNGRIKVIDTNFLTAIEVNKKIVELLNNFNLFSNTKFTKNII